MRWLQAGRRRRRHVPASLAVQGLDQAVLARPVRSAFGARLRWRMLTNARTGLMVSICWGG